MSRLLVVAAVLAAGAVLAGPVNGAAAAGIEGEVTAATGGAPIGGVLVCAYAVSGGGFEEECEVTGSDGIYAISNLPAGKYKVEFWPRYEDLNYLMEYYDDQAFWEAATKVTVTAGVTTTGIDAQLQEGGQIAGRVSASSNGAPLAEVVVCAEGVEEEFFACAITDSNGEYAIVGLATDDYRVEFWPGSSGLNFIPQYYDHQAAWADANPVPVEAGMATPGIDAALDPGAQIKGTVVAASSNAPLAEIGVCAFDVVLNQLVRCAITGPAGQYALVGLPSGPYKVVFSLEFREWFEGEAAEEDGYLTQFYNGKPTLVAADTLGLVAPSTTLGVDARLLSSTPSPPAVLPKPPATTVPPLISHPKPKPRKPRCRKGRKAKKVKGKYHCVKKHEKKHHPRHGKHGPHAVATGR